MRRTLLVWLWRRRSEAWSALSALCHDSTEQVIGTVSKGWRRRLRWAGVLGRAAQGRSARVASASLKLAMESLNLLIISMICG
jgi:hypothetical protein